MMSVGWRLWLWWVLANTVGWAVGGYVGVAVVNTDVAWIVGAGACGTVLGVLQWLVLRRQVARAGRWVLASTVGWIVGGPLAGIGGWVVLGAVYGAITGPVLVRLLRKPV